MSGVHSFFSPSKSEMWLHCHGAMAMPQNQADGGSSTFADDGTASHTWGAECLIQETDAENLLGAVQTINGVEYRMDEERSRHVQTYVDDVRRRAIGGHLFVEYKVDLSSWLGEGQGGTTDAGIYFPAQKLLISEDLKYGQGYKVYASFQVQAATATMPEVRRPNPQLALYALGLLADISLLGPVDRVLLVVSQPRLGHIDEFEMTVPELLAFGEQVKLAVAENNLALKLKHGDPDLQLYLKPSDGACQWCRAKSGCPKLADYVQQQVKADFETLAESAAPLPGSEKLLSRAIAAVPLIEQWCKAVRAEVWHKVTTGETVMGPDGQPYKIVEGKGGKRIWSDPVKAEAALLATLGEMKTYAPREIITAPAADKLFPKARRQQWEDTFLNKETGELIVKTKGSLSLALGSDPRPPATNAASGEDFDELGSPE